MDTTKIRGMATDNGGEVVDTRQFPPCIGNCRQWRDCPANGPRSEMTGREAWALLASIAAPWAIGALVLWAIARAVQ